MHDPIFVTNPNAGIVEDVATTGQVIALTWPDVPGDGKFVNLLDNPSCAGSGHAAQTMTVMSMLDTFRIWVCGPAPAERLRRARCTTSTGT